MNSTYGEGKRAGCDSSSGGRRSPPSPIWEDGSTVDEGQIGFCREAGREWDGQSSKHIIADREPSVLHFGLPCAWR